MISEQLVDLSRLQFAATAMYHFLFVPLTIGMVWLLVIMESVYVMTGKVIWKDMTRFWGKLFGINFALGVTTGITLEFQFGTNWAYYSHYVGDIFGAPLAIEGLMAFFLESTFIGLFFFGWDRLSKTQHLLVTTLMAVGTNLSALWILIANGWMQNPVGAKFSYETMRRGLWQPAARRALWVRCAPDLNLHRQLLAIAQPLCAADGGGEQRHDHHARRGLPGPTPASRCGTACPAI